METPNKPNPEAPKHITSRSSGRTNLRHRETQPRPQVCLRTSRRRMSCQARLFDWGLGVQGPWLRAGFIMPCEFDCAWELCKNKVQLGIAGLAKPVLKKA